MMKEYTLILQIFQNWELTQELGINPRSTTIYNAVGIWAYPLDYLLKHNRNIFGDELFSNRKYAFIFKQTGNILKLNEVTSEQEQKLFKHSIDYFISKGVDENLVINHAKFAWSKRDKFWEKLKMFYIMNPWSDSKILSSDAGLSLSLLKAGYHAVLDDGGYQITSDIPVQSIHFTTKTIKTLELLTNK